MTESIALALAYLVDLIIGDPRWFPHPVRLIGRAIEKYDIYLREKVLNVECDIVADEVTHKRKNKKWDTLHKMSIFKMVPLFMKKGKGLSLDAYEKWAGVILAVVISGSTFLLFYVVTKILFLVQFSAIASYISFAIFVYLISTTLATRDLLKSGRAVIEEIRKGDLEKSKIKLSMIVGRDTESLEETDVLRAAIETLSENASDGIVAPLFYFAIGGLPLAMAYKAINTLDSMVGYKNEKYGNFGWAAAKLDDVVNYIPARITALLIIASSYIINFFRFLVWRGSRSLDSVQNRVGRMIKKIIGWFEKRSKKPDFGSSHNSFEIMMRDGRNHSSPNAGMPEAAMAGALGVRLGGPSIYGEQKVNKPYIGDILRNMKNRKETTEKIYYEAAMSAMVITRVTSFLGFLVVLVVL